VLYARRYSSKYITRSYILVFKPYYRASHLRRQSSKLTRRHIPEYSLKIVLRYLRRQFSNHTTRRFQTVFKPYYKTLHYRRQSSNYITRRSISEDSLQTINRPSHSRRVFKPLTMRHIPEYSLQTINKPSHSRIQSSNL
jgi:hypothetical protein